MKKLGNIPNGWPVSLGHPFFLRLGLHLEEHFSEPLSLGPVILQGGGHINVDLPRGGYTAQSHSSSEDTQEKSTHTLASSLKGWPKRILRSNRLRGAGVGDNFWEAVILTYTSACCASRNLTV